MMANISHQILDVDRKQEAAYEREYGILLEIYRVERDMMRRISGRRDKQGTDIDIDGSILDLRDLRDKSISVDFDSPDIKLSSSAAALPLPIVMDR